MNRRAVTLHPTIPVDSANGHLVERGATSYARLRAGSREAPGFGQPPGLFVQIWSNELSSVEELSLCSADPHPLGLPKIRRMTNERTDWGRLFTLWETLGRPEPPEIPKDALISEGITLDAYEEWRVDLEAEKIRERELRADAAAADKRDAELRAQGMEPLPPKRSPEEVAAIEQREQEAEERAQRRRERAGESEWEDEGGR